jgi:hypothetical protein
MMRFLNGDANDRPDPVRSVPHALNGFAGVDRARKSPRPNCLKGTCVARLYRLLVAV